MPHVGHKTVNYRHFCVVLQLSYCVVQFIEKDVTLSESVCFFLSCMYFVPVSVATLRFECLNLFNFVLYLWAR